MQPEHLWQEESNALATLKGNLISAPVLSLPPREGILTMHTDAFNRQIGWVLPQDQRNGTKDPVGYWSRTINAAEQN